MLLPAEVIGRGSGGVGHHPRAVLPPVLEGGTGYESDTDQKPEVFKRDFKDDFRGQKTKYIKTDPGRGISRYPDFFIEKALAKRGLLWYSCNRKIRVIEP